MRLGVVSNPLARRNLRNGVVAASAASLQIPVSIFRAGAELEDDLRRMIADGVTDLVVDGGDGTVTAVVSGLLRMRPDLEPPRLILVPSGTTNLVASRLGDSGDRSTLFARLRGMTPTQFDACTRIQAPMQIDRGGGSPLLHGFLAGLGAFHAGTLRAQSRIRQLGLRDGAAVALGLAAGLWQTVFGSHRSVAFSGEPMSLTVDRIGEPGERRVLLLVSVLDRLSMGLRPFWGSGSQSLRWLSVQAHPKALLRALPRVLSGRPARWMEAAGYRSGRADVLDIGCDLPFVLDGEFVNPGASGAIRICTARPLRFLRLPAA